MDITAIIADVIIALVLLIPIIWGSRRGLLDAIFRLGRKTIVFIVACLLVKPISQVIKRLIYPTVFDRTLSYFGEEGGTIFSAESMLEKVPEGVKSTLAATGYNLEEMAADAATQSDMMVESFASSIADIVSNAVSFVIAFAGIVLIGSLLLLILRPLLNGIVKKLPVVKTVNKILGGIFGAVVGLLLAWILAQLFAWGLSFFTESNWVENSILLAFFHRFNPLLWIFAALMQGATLFAG